MDSRPYDTTSIFLFADSFLPAIFATQGLAAWVPIIELTVNALHMCRIYFVTGNYIIEESIP
jgi:hypothetical protein